MVRKQGEGKLCPMYAALRLLGLLYNGEQGGGGGGYAEYDDPEVTRLTPEQQILLSQLSQQLRTVSNNDSFLRLECVLLPPPPPTQHGHSSWLIS